MQHDSEDHRLPDAEHPLPALSGVRADLLDCVQSNLAVLADHFHGPGTHLNLGSKLSSRWYPGADGLPTVDPPLAEQLAEAERCLHLRVTGRGTVTGSGLPGAVEPGAPYYAVADAYEMPWLPYHRQRHMDHSFLLLAPEGSGDRWTVVDAYDNDTSWGAARPGAWTLTAKELTVLGDIELFGVAPRPGAGERPRLRVEHPPMDEYLAAFDRGSDREAVLHRLTGDAWLLARSRTLHARFVAGGAPDEETARHLELWNQLVTHTYVAYRRVARGRPEPPGLVERLAGLLDADRGVFRDTELTPAAAHPGRGDTADGAPDGVRDQVAEVVAAVLGGDPGALRADTDLRTVEGFSSFRMVDIIDRLEARLGIECDSDDLLPENLRSVEGLCRVVRGARSTR
ncbi:hypothetical protein TU94_04305 [Streptomyces cyaneogriseus subsp. noncyanogenus]|uniref:Carrier domain-containing protein n=1 Tax=Streptomyces cyaneogriseus subsp. noncyanogenus TaxID=477245 RepID=A0A0C5FWH9_9ACTN|nr:acyl carrier protein [Streptomyces cyaneogriseus]AJP00815.1 hypothetical protein TU94_04305 [Streptomyces cyaneogriseus subsp. noncyanogenus]